MKLPGTKAPKLTPRQKLILAALAAFTSALMFFGAPVVRSIPGPVLQAIAGVLAMIALICAFVFGGLLGLAKLFHYTTYERPGTFAHFAFVALGAVLMCSFAAPFNILLMAGLGTAELNGSPIGPGLLRQVLSIPFWLLLLAMNMIALGTLYGVVVAFLRLCVRFEERGQPTGSP